MRRRTAVKSWRMQERLLATGQLEAIYRGRQMAKGARVARGAVTPTS